jgi:anti-sigma-K factor RskA
MSPETHVIESLPAYALSCLDEAEAQQIAEHLVGCAVCRKELAAFQAVADQLALLAPAAAPPPDLQDELMARVRSLSAMNRIPPQRARRPFRQSLRPAWGIAMLLLILALVVTNLLLWQRVNRLEVLTGPQGLRAITLSGTEAAPQASGFVIMSADGQNGALVVDAMPQLEPEQQYQLWLVRDGQHTSGGLFPVDESGYRGVRITAPESLLEYTAVLITIEPAEGSPSPTGTPIMEGSLHNS